MSTPEPLGRIMRLAYTEALTSSSARPLANTSAPFNFMLVLRHWLHVAAPTLEIWLDFPVRIDEFERAEDMDDAIQRKTQLRLLSTWIQRSDFFLFTVHCLYMVRVVKAMTRPAISLMQLLLIHSTRLAQRQWREM